MDYLVHGLDANRVSYALPTFVLEIMESDDMQERQLLLQYLQMYGKLRKIGKRGKNDKKALPADNRQRLFRAYTNAFFYI